MGLTGDFVLQDGVQPAQLLSDTSLRTSAPLGAQGRGALVIEAYSFSSSLSLFLLARYNRCFASVLALSDLERKQLVAERPPDRWAVFSADLLWNVAAQQHS